MQALQKTKHHKLHYKIIGMLSLGLGTLGAFLPLLPTTVFILIAAACFAKSCPKMHQMLIEHRLFGRMIQQWETNRCMPTKAKWFAIISMLVSGGISLITLHHPLLQIAIVLLIGSGIYYVATIKHCTLAPAKSKSDNDNK